MVRVTPWLLLGTSCGVIAGLMALVAAWPRIAWPLQGACVGVIAGVAAMALDERSASIVDTLPRSLLWRSAARAAIVVPALLTVWIGCLLAWQHRLPPHSGLFALQGVTAAAAAVAVTGRRRAAGVAEPGAPFAAATMPTVLALALIRPWTRWLPLFPIWPWENWPRSWAIWCATAVAVPALGTVTIRGFRRSHGALAASASRSPHLPSGKSST
jgi:hypothetical protein